MKTTLIALLALGLCLPLVAADKDKPLPEDFKSLKALAEKGDAASQHSLGLRYYEGEGVKRDSVTAYAWWVIAASNGNKEATKDKRILDRALTDQQVKAGQDLARDLMQKISKDSKTLKTPTKKPDIISDAEKRGFVVGVKTAKISRSFKSHMLKYSDQKGYERTGEFIINVVRIEILFNKKGQYVRRSSYQEMPKDAKRVKNHMSSYSYDEEGRLKTVISEGDYNFLGVIDAPGKMKEITRYEYGRNGKISKIKSQRFEGPEAGELMSHSETLHIYGDNGSIKTTMNKGQLLFGGAWSDANSLIAKYFYNDQGNLVKTENYSIRVKDGKSRTSLTQTKTISYERGGKRETIIYPNGGSRMEIYDLDGNLIEERSGTGMKDVVSFKYDEKGNPVEERNVSGVMTLYENSYDKKGSKIRTVETEMQYRLFRGSKREKSIHSEEKAELSYWVADNIGGRDLSPEEEKLVGTYIYIGKGKAYPKGGTIFKKVLRADGVYEKWTDDKKSSVEFKWVVKNGELLVSSSAFTTIYKIGSNGDIAKIGEIINGRRMIDPSGPGSTYKRVKKVAANQNPKPLPSEIERIKRLAENGDPASQYSLGLRYYQGKGVKKNSVTAYAWWEIAASNGNKAAARDKRILDRELTEQQVKAGRELSRILKKNPKMMIPKNQVVIPKNQVVIPKNQVVIPKNQVVIPKHLMKFKADADKGDAGSQYLLGLWFYHGQNGLKRDAKEAAGWFLKAALQKHVEAMRILALLYRNGGPGQKADPVESMKWLRKLAEIGDAQGQLLFGMSFVEEVARGGPPKNNKELLRLFPKNKAEAVGWIRKSAVQGCVPAQYNLGVIYFEGKHLPRDFKKAFLWHSKAAESGYSDAQANLGAMYFNGDGIPRDLVKAYVWNSIAGDKRFKDAAAKRMTPEQITKAQELVKEMVKKNPKLLDRREALGFGFPKR
jgi:TPR repeat protein